MQSPGRLGAADSHARRMSWFAHGGTLIRSHRPYSNAGLFIYDASGPDHAATQKQTVHNPVGSRFRNRGQPIGRVARWLIPCWSAACWWTTIWWVFRARFIQGPVARLTFNQGQICQGHIHPRHVGPCSNREEPSRVWSTRTQPSDRLLALALVNECDGKMAVLAWARR
jgi:hypothetical protein